MHGQQNVKIHNFFLYFILYIQPLKMELIEGSETSASQNPTQGKYPKEYVQDSEHGESLKSRIIKIIKYLQVLQHVSDHKRFIIRERYTVLG